MAAGTLRITRPVLLIFILCAVLPFILRLGLDTATLRSQAISTLYRDWRWHPETLKLIDGHKTLILDPTSSNPQLEELFRLNLSQEFRIADVGEYPRIRFFAKEDNRIQARIDFFSLKQLNPSAVWEGDVRIANNGILLGPWTGAFLWSCGYAIWVCFGACFFLILLWWSHWSLLDVPGELLSVFNRFVNEISERAHIWNWNASELSRLPLVASVLYIVVAGFFLLLFTKKKSLLGSSQRTAIFISFLLEPVVLWSVSRFAKWESDVVWWKIYFVSILFRFVTGGIILLITLYPHLLSVFKKDTSRHTRFTKNYVYLLWPFIFVFCEGWSWSHAVLNGQLHETIAMLKIFLMGLLLAFVMGSRIFSMWFGALVLAFVLPFNKGHFLAGAAYGLLFDGLVVGWYLTPYKALRPVLPFLSSAWRMMLLTIAISWFVGVFLWSVGVPLPICWLILALSIWSIVQLRPVLISGEGGFPLATDRRDTTETV